MKRLIIIFLVLIAPLAYAQEEGRFYTIGLGQIDPSDTLRFCWADTWTEEGKRAVQLFQLYADLYIQRMKSLDSQVILSQEKNGELEQQLKENDAYWDGLREGYENFLKQDISEEEKEGLMQQLADIERNKAQSRNDILQQFQLLKKEAGEMNKEINPADITPERLYTLKRASGKT